MKKVFRFVLGVFLMLGLVVLPVHSLMAADAVVVIDADQTREGSTFLAGDEVRIDGTIDGDLYVAAETVTVNGSINGDLIGFARNLTISGPIQGDVRAFAQTVRLKGPISGSATIGGETLYLENQAAVGRDLVAGCSTANIDGLINGSLFAATNDLFINGGVAKDVKVKVGTLNVGEGASVGGDLTYVSGNDGYISKSARIGGKVLWKPDTSETVPDEQKSPWSVGGFLISLAGILIIYWLASKVRPQIWTNLAQPARERVTAAAGIGLLLLISTPILAILAMITVVGIPLGIIIVITYGLLLYVSKLVASIYLADLLKSRYNLEQPWLWFAVLVALMLAVHIPYVGWVISVAVLSLGLGCGFYVLFGSKDTKTGAPDTIA